MLRIERAIQTLKGWKESTVGDVGAITVYKGDFSCPAEARQKAKPAQTTIVYGYTVWRANVEISACIFSRVTGMAV